MYLDKSKSKLQMWSNINPKIAPRPCSEIEISDLEKTLDLVLPLAYREFLLWMGHGCGSFFRGIDIFYKSLLDIQDWAIELLEENKSEQKLPQDAFIFMMNQGYQFAYFLLNDEENPRIFYYREGKNHPKFELYFDTLDEFILTNIKRAMKY